MTPEAQRIAIAEACGWKPQIYGPEWHQSETKMPNYPSDLNAMREARKLIPRNFHGMYCVRLYCIIHGRSFDDLQELPKALDGQAGPWFDVVDATAAQHAEAFLRTLNLWKE